MGTRLSARRTRLWLCSEVDDGTEVNLRVSYAVPENLMSHVGPVGVWGDVNDILQENLILMKVGRLP